MTSPVFPYVFYFTKSPYHIRVYQTFKNFQRIPAPFVYKKTSLLWSREFIRLFYDKTSVAGVSSAVSSTGVSSVCVAFANEPTY